MCKKETNNVCCCLFSLIASLISAAGIAAIFYAGLITSITALLYVTLVFGIIGLIYVIFKAFFGNKNVKNPCLISSIVGSIVTSIFALTATSLTTFSVAVAILIGVVAFFLVSTLINFVNIIIGSLGFGNYED